MVFGALFTTLLPYLGSTFLGWGKLGTGLLTVAGAFLDSQINKPDSPKNQPPDQASPGFGLGQPILTLHGTDRKAGHRIWQHSEGFVHIDDLKIGETGGILGIGSKDVTRPIYGHSFAVLFGNAPTSSGIIAINKIWIENKLWFNKSSDATQEELADADKKIRTGAVTFYLGSETQTADPTMEDDLGTGNVPAYRGQIYAVFKRLSVDIYSNQIPNLIEARTVEGGTINAATWEEVTPTTGEFIPRSRAGAVSHNDKIFVMGGLIGITGTTASVISTSNGLSIKTEDSLPLSVDSITPVSINNLIYAAGGISAGGSGVSNKLYVFNGSSWSDRETLSPFRPLPRHSYGAFKFRWDIDGAESYNVCGGEIDASENPLEGNFNGHVRDIWSTINGYTWERRALDGGFGYRRDHTCLNLNGSVLLVGGIVEPIPNPKYGDGGAPQWLSLTEESNGIYLLSGALNHSKFSLYCTDFMQYIPSLIDGSTILNSSAAFPHSAGAIWGGCVWAGKYVIFTDGSKDINDPVSNQWKAFYSTTGANGSWSELSFSGTPTNFDFSNTFYPTVVENLGSIFIFGGETTTTITDKIYKSTIENSDVGTTTDEAILTKVFEDRGLVDGVDFDVSALSGNTRRGFAHGFESGEQIANRLRIPGLFDLSSDGEKIVAVKRGQSSIVTIPEDDLGVRELGEQQKEKQEENRKSETDLPAEIIVKYYDPEINYLESTQAAQRTGYVRSGTQKGMSRANKKVVVDTGTVMTADEAAQLANVLIDDAWQERHTGGHRLGNKYLYLMPTDVITTQLNSLDTKFRLTEMQSGSPGIINTKSVAETIEYTSAATGANPNSNPRVYEPKHIPVGTDYRILDIPALSVGHTRSPGVYVAMAPSNPDISIEQWGGASVWGSLDGTDYVNSLAVKSVADVIGRAQTVLDAPAYVPVMDNANTVDVELDHSGMTLRTATETDIGNGVNRCLLGDEIIAFTTYESLGDNVYRLSGLRRGLLGTEWAVGTHAVNDRFIVLDTVSRIEFSEDYRQKRIFFKIVSFAQLPSDVEATQIEYENICQKPYAPVHVKAKKNLTTGRWTIRWVPQVMAQTPLINSVIPPLRADNRYWEIDFYDDDGDVLGTVEIDFWSLDQTSDLARIENNEQGFCYGFNTGVTLRNSTAKIYDETDRDTIKFGIYQISGEFGGDNRGYGVVKEFNKHGDTV